MSGRRVSRTALGTAHMRAAHQVLESPPRVLEDPLATEILGVDATQIIRDRAERYQTPGQRLLRASVVLRSRYAEDRLAASLARAVTQYAILVADISKF